MSESGEHIVGEDKEMRKFCQQLVDHTQFQKLRLFTVGSFVESKRTAYSDDELGVNIASTDCDMMFYNSLLYAFPRTQRVPVCYKGRILRIYSDQTHPGYVMLVDEKCSSSF